MANDFPPPGQRWIQEKHDKEREDRLRAEGIDPEQHMENIRNNMSKRAEASRKRNAQRNNHGICC